MNFYLYFHSLSILEIHDFKLVNINLKTTYLNNRKLFTETGRTLKINNLAHPGVVFKGELIKN